ncbi:MAG: cytochrome c [Acidimicrobiia bacterium]|nr:cytochrome c [Acidimicrobiia bacterium]
MTRPRTSQPILIAVLMCDLFVVSLASQQTPRSPSETALVDRYQRTYEVLTNNEVASSGAARGETIYFYKCWMCHNQGGRKGDKSGLVGPALGSVVSRMKTQDAVTARIKNGGPRMPAFRHTLSEAGLSDLVAYLATPTCCYENDEPIALNRFQWIDNSTTPPTIWYPDFLTQMFVRIQPLE